MILRNKTEEEAWIAFAAASLGGARLAEESVNPNFAVMEASRLADMMLQEFVNRRDT